MGKIEGNPFRQTSDASDRASTKGYGEGEVTRLWWATKGYGDILVFSRTIPVLVDGRGGRIGREGQGTKQISIQSQITKFNKNRVKKLS